jgi:hypothetical protein
MRRDRSKRNEGFFYEHILFLHTIWHKKYIKAIWVSGFKVKFGLDGAISLNTNIASTFFYVPVCEFLNIIFSNFNFILKFPLF